MNPGHRADADRMDVAAVSLSPSEFGGLFEEASRRLWCIAAAITGDRSLADDVLQEAAMVALRKLEQFEPGTSFAAWMARIVRLTALNQARRRARIRSVEVETERLDAATGGDVGAASPPVDARGRLVNAGDTFDDRVLAALQSLEETARACLLLRSVLDLPYAEIARALDIPEGTAMSHVHRARQTLRERLPRPAAAPDPDRTTHA